MKCENRTSSPGLFSILLLSLVFIGFPALSLQAQDDPQPAGPGESAPAPANVLKPYLGIQVQPITILKKEFHQKLQLPKNAGLVVVFVQPGSPADRMGVKANEVIAAIDNQTLYGLQHFQGLMSNKKPGQKIRLSLFNNKAKVRHLTIRLGSSADKPQVLVQKGDPNPTNQQPGPNALRDTKIEIKDAHHYMVITIKPSKAQHLLVKDNKGKTLFNGPINTAAEQKKLAKPIMDKITTFAPRLPIKWYMKKVKFAPTPGPTDKDK